MTSLPRLAFLASLFPFATYAAPTGGIYDALLRYSATQQQHDDLSFATTAVGSRALLGQLLITPSSPYSELETQPGMTNEIWWDDFVDSVSPTSTTAREDVLGTLQRQLGLTKARPGIEVFLDDSAIAAYRGREVAANALKARVDADLFWKARDLNGSRITIAAAEAVALQILREQMASTPEHLWELMDIRPDVLSRYLQRQNPQQYPERDHRYLHALLREALLRVDERPIPATYRVARVAAAYSDQLGYYNSEGYCRDDAPRPGLPLDMTALDDHAPLCFVAATDRGVRAWFERQARLEASGARIHESPTDRSSRVAALFGLLLTLGDAVAFVEALEADTALELVGDGSLDERDAFAVADRPICRKPLP